MKHERIMCIDAMRGFDMFWIIGGRELILAASVLTLGKVPGPVAYQLRHPEWDGFPAWDLIMPIFLFLVGAVLPFSILRERDAGTPLTRIYFRIGQRVFLLWALGLMMEGSIIKAVYSGNIYDIQIYSSTLHAIAVAYLFAALTVLHLDRRGQMAVLSAALLIYWAAMTFIPFGVSPAGTFQSGSNFAQYVDDIILRRFADTTAYTWVLSSLGFTATVLLGIFAGHLLASERNEASKLQLLVASGILLLILGLIWNQFHPINRRIWTSSMVLWAGGWSYLLLALFFYSVDMRRWRRWLFPFTVIGSNAILAYMLGEQWVQTWVRIMDPEGQNTLVEGVASGLALASLYALLHIMFRNRIFLRV